MVVAALTAFYDPVRARFFITATRAIRIISFTFVSAGTTLLCLGLAYTAKVIDTSEHVTIWTPRYLDPATERSTGNGRICHRKDHKERACLGASASQLLSINLHCLSGGTRYYCRVPPAKYRPVHNALARAGSATSCDDGDVPGSMLCSQTRPARLCCETRPQNLGG